MMRILTLLIILILPAQTKPQELLDIKTKNACSYYGEVLEGKIYGFDSSVDAERIISQITDAVGLKPNFKIRAANIPNAMAYIESGKRLILYSENFIFRITNATGTDWAGISVLAHEIGHHLNGHSLTNEGSRPELELEADEFSGFVLAELGASLEEAQTAIKQVGTSSGSTTHPAKSARLEAIAVGWKKGGGNKVTPSKKTENNVNKSKSASPSVTATQLGDACFKYIGSSIYTVKLKVMERNTSKIVGNTSISRNEDLCFYELKPGIYVCTAEFWMWRYSKPHQVKNFEIRVKGGETTNMEIQK